MYHQALEKPIHVQVVSMVLDIVVRMKKVCSERGGGGGAGVVREQIGEMSPKVRDSSRDCGNDFIGKVFASHTGGCVFPPTRLDT